MEDPRLQDRLVQLCESLAVPILMLKPDHTIISANSIFFTKYQLRKKDVIGRKCHQVLFYADCPFLKSDCPMDILLSEKRCVSKVRKTESLVGSYDYVDMYYSPLLNDDGEVDYIVVTIKDITQSKLMEADLNKTKEFLEKIINSSVNAIVVTDMKGAVLLMNASAAELLAYTGKTGVSKVFVEKYYASNSAKSIMERLRSPDFGGVGKMHSMETKIINSAGEVIPVEMTASIIYEDGREVATMGIFQDLRPRLAAERKLEKTRMQLVQSDKLASIGRLAAGVAHEINNPLGGIIMYSHLVMEDVPQNSPYRQNLEKLVAQAERCQQIVKGLLDFSRQGTHDVEPRNINNINEIIEEILAMVGNQAVFHNITVTKALDPDPPVIKGDSSQLQQVFMNFTMNAAEAMSDGGELIVRSTRRDAFIEIQFTDTGCGIPAKDREKIFEPFFTTKSDRDGTGLGLAISHGIISKHKGAISVESREGAGTTFTIRLPVNAEK